MDERTYESRLALRAAYLHSHDMNMKRVYNLRWGGLALSAFTIGCGALMTFFGLEGSFNWAIEAPHSITAKLANASPGIVFATVGFILGLVVVSRKPVTVRIQDDGYLLGVDDSTDVIMLELEKDRARRNQQQP